MQRSTHLVWLIAGLVLVGFVMRSPLSSVGPILPGIRDDLGLSSAVAGLTGTIPLICFSVFALSTPFLMARFGPEKTLGGAIVVLMLATCCVPPVAPRCSSLAPHSSAPASPSRTSCCPPWCASGSPSASPPCPRSTSS